MGAEHLKKKLNEKIFISINEEEFPKMKKNLTIWIECIVFNQG